MDDERLKNPDGRPDHFDELRERIRDIRASEKGFYQKVRELFALSSGYDKTYKATQVFFATVQNLLIYAVTQRTAAELVTARANGDDPHFGLLHWKGAKVRKGDILVAKNYLTEDEMDKAKLVALMSTHVTEANLNEFGRFDDLKATVDQLKSKTYFEGLEGKQLPLFRVNIRTAKLLQDFILQGGGAI